MQRFHLSPLGIKDGMVSISDQRVVQQLTRVLRAKPRDFFHIFNAEEGECLVQIGEIAKRHITARVIEQIKNDNEPRLSVGLYFAIPKKPALFELVLQKATEIGADHIYPLITERTEGRRMSRFDRLQAIAVEATEQSRRLKIPTIHHPVNYEEALKKMESPYIAYEYESAKFLADYASDIKKAQEISLIIGPEGGFSEKEIAFAKKCGAKAFTFGPRILRMETAAISALSLVLLAD